MKLGKTLSGYKNIMFHGKGKDKFFAWFLVILIIIFIFTVCSTLLRGSNVTKIETSEFILQIQADNVEEMHICHGDFSINGKFREEVNGVLEFTTNIPNDQEVFIKEYINTLSKKPETEDYKPLVFDYEKTSNLFNILSNIIIFVIEIGLIMLVFLYVMKSQGGSLGIANKAPFKTDIPKCSFDDVAGVPEAIEEMSEIVAFLKNPYKYDIAGAKFPKGVLMVGPPGTGKTLLARALAGEANVPFIHSTGSDFIEMFVGLGAKRIRELFDKAREVQPAIIFIDEIDSLGGKRDGGGAGGGQEHLQTINQLFAEMDGFNKEDKIIVIAATNRAESLDPALTRPGRFDRIISVDTPSREGRLDILRLYAQNKPFSSDVDFDKLSRHTYGFSGAELENVMNQAATLAARRAVESGSDPLITAEDLDEGISRSISGPALKSKKMSDEEKKITAYHEAGHAVVQYVLPGCDPIQKISIVSRHSPGIGTALGYVQSYSEEDSYITTADKCHDIIASLLAGRCSEEINCNIQSSGASNDLEKASDLAYRMISEFAFQEDSDNTSFRVNVRDPKTSMLMSGQKRLDEIDENVKNMLNIEYKRAKCILQEHQNDIKRIVERLLENEVIDSDEIKEIMSESQS